MSNEKPVELTEAEREALFKAGEHHPDQCDCTAFADEVGYAPGSEICDALADTYDVVARIKAAARRKALLEAIERIESLSGDYTNGGQTLSWQGARHCVETALTEPERDEESGR